MWWGRFSAGWQQKHRAVCKGYLGKRHRQLTSARHTLHLCLPACLGRTLRICSSSFLRASTKERSCHFFFCQGHFFLSRPEAFLSLFMSSLTRLDDRALLRCPGKQGRAVMGSNRLRPATIRQRKVHKPGQKIQTIQGQGWEWAQLQHHSQQEQRPRAGLDPGSRATGRGWVGEGPGGQRCPQGPGRVSEEFIPALEHRHHVLGTSMYLV